MNDKHEFNDQKPFQKQKLFKASKSCALCGGSGKMDCPLSDGTPMVSDCTCVETGKPVMRNPNDTSVQRAKTLRARKQKREAAKKRLKNMRRR